MEDIYTYKHNPIVKRIFISMLAPTILMNLTTAIGSMADTVIIGHYLDDLSLSVVTFATPIYMVINTFAALFAVGGCIAMSIDTGKGEKANANKAFSLSVELLVLVGSVLLLLGLFFSNTITGLLGAEEDVFELVRTYSKIILLGAPVFVLNIGAAFFVRNDGRPTLSMIGMLLSIVVDIILNVIFVGHMDMGVTGAALSTVLGQLVSLVVIGTHFLSSKNTLRFSFTCNTTALRICKNGGSAALHFVYQFVTILIINHFLARVAGTNGVVVYTVVFNLSTVALAVFEGISQTIQPMISTYYGEKSNKNIKETLRLAFMTILIICGSITLLLEIFPQFVPMVFGIDDMNLIQKSVVAVRIYASSLIIMTVNVVIGYYLQSTEQNFMASVLISLRCFAVFLAATVILGKLLGMNGVWAAYTLAEVITFVIYLIIVAVKRKRCAANGVCVDWYLLQKSTEVGISCYTCNVQKQDYAEFIRFVTEAMKTDTCFRECVLRDTEEYLLRLQGCSKKRRGGFVEVEFNREEKKIVIRDDLEHPNTGSGICASLSEESTWDYGPVLGWNRICLE